MLKAIKVDALHAARVPKCAQEGRLLCGVGATQLWTRSVVWDAGCAARRALRNVLKSRIERSEHEDEEEME